jgi:hypothetical protein
MNKILDGSFIKVINVSYSNKKYVFFLKKGNEQ